MAAEPNSHRDRTEQLLEALWELIQYSKWLVKETRRLVDEAQRIQNDGKRSEPPRSLPINHSSRNGAMETEANDSDLKTALGTICRTGENCPYNGVWQSVDDASKTVRVAKRSRMPQMENRAVDWKLIQVT